MHALPQWEIYQFAQSIRLVRNISYLGQPATFAIWQEESNMKDTKPKV